MESKKQKNGSWEELYDALSEAYNKVNVTENKDVIFGIGVFLSRIPTLDAPKWHFEFFLDMVREKAVMARAIITKKWNLTKHPTAPCDKCLTT